MPKDKADKAEIYEKTPHLILCEGADARFFLMWLLDFLKKDNPAFSVFRVYDFGGNTDLKQYLKNFAQTDGFKTIVKSLCIIRDAETGADSACQSIQMALNDCGFAVPEKPCSRVAGGNSSYPSITIGFLLFPDCNDTPQNGTLEDLCLRTLAQEEAADILSAADAALDPYKERLPRLHKNRLHSYFSLTDKFVSLKIGEAARDGAFRYDAPEIEALKSFLLQMAGA